jgi:hypothetical protein
MKSWQKLQFFEVEMSTSLSRVFYELLIIQF